MPDKKKLFISPFSSIWFVLSGMAIYFGVSGLISLKFGCFDIESTGATETLTYIFYGVGLGIALCCNNNINKNTYFALIFLWVSALLREMGIQHWLTTHDTVVTKIRFFTNPSNPLHEKIIAAVLMMIVLMIAGWLIFKYTQKVINGILKRKPLSWTILVFIILMIITQIADRLPANYLKSTGTALPDIIIFILKILEEGGESLLPLLFGIGFIQHKHTYYNKIN